ncbi:hypothetical protein [Cellulomonas sp. NPDC058312]|uniref:hypothetical protein n=1 Tax=Cellulomonas sp. NPDC058312 TaxID=3346441 RepID=UPI0036E524C5
MLLLVAVIGLSGCATGPSEDEREAASDLAWRTSVGTAEQAIGRLPALFPEVEFTRNDFPEDFDHWADCSSSSPGSATDPTAIQWLSLRQVLVDPPRETETFGRALVEAYVAEGWTLPEERPAREDDPSVEVDLRRDGYVLTVLWVTTPDAGLAPLVRVSTVSPCLDAPERMGDWQWRPGPTAPPAAG